MKNCDRGDVDEKIMIKAMAMVKFFLKVFRVHASVCLLVATALDKMHLWHRLLMKDLAR